MKRLLPIAALVFLLAGCAATPAAATHTTPAATQAPAPTPSSTPTTAAQGLKALSTAVAAMPDDKKDAIFLAGVHPSVTDHTDADLIAAGHKACELKASGLVNGDLTTAINNLGFTGSQGFIILLTASLAYCPAK